MSTVLTNGIIIPDNGSRNWGGDLANNWNIIDLNVGYMTDVKNRVTTLENSVTTLENSTAENTANIQTNASNISSLQTSKQDVIADLETIRSGASAGATAVQPSTLNNYVDLSSRQTINATKTFTVSPLCANSDATIGFFIRNNAMVRNEVPSQFYHSTFRVYDKNDKILGEYCVEKSTSGSSLLNMNVRTDTSDGTQISKSLYLNLKNDGSDVSFYPSTNNEFSLGTSTNKWKTINGINPGALSFPSTSYVSLDTTDWLLDGSTVNQISTSNSCVYVSIMTDCDDDGFIDISLGNYPNGHAYINSKSVHGHCGVFIPIANINGYVKFFIKANSIRYARLYSLRGDI